MFNTTIVRQSAPYPQEVHEHKAPTDDSVRLLHELEKAALDKVISVNRLTDNLFSAVWTVHDDKCYMEQKIIVRFVLNGSEMEVEAPIDRHLNQRDTAKVAIKAIADAISRKIVGSLMRSTDSVTTRLIGA